ncbi:MAG: hypothetical protein ATN31_10980 [Candidatus Epulonipiscioides saccharophilum]|nr:MAG: hypothetical protein ATN31_10980 [Epulopiscium sp. AS2M-Bin001]
MNIEKILFDNLKLIGQIIENPNNNHLNFAELEEIINIRLPELANRNAPPNFYSLYNDFKLGFQQFKDFILYKELIGKNVVALGGGFSSGKSTFLNALNGENALPEDVNPSTSIPTYVINAERHKVSVINIFNNRVEIIPRQIKNIAYGFGKIECDGATVSQSLTLGHIVSSLLLESPKQVYSNLAFLDTPGYAKPNTEDYSKNTDEAVIREQLNSANFILWFVDAEQNSLSNDDLNLIHSLREDIPKIIIISKSDKKARVELENIKDNIQKILRAKGIEYLDILFTSTKNLDGYDTPKLKEYFRHWNDITHNSNFAKNFKFLFVQCHQFYETEIEKGRHKLQCLNKSLTQMDSLPDEALKPLELVVEEIRKNVISLLDVNEGMRMLQIEFFTHLKLIGDTVGIDLPLPSEIELISHVNQDVAKWLDSYSKLHSIKNNTSIKNVLSKTPDANTKNQLKHFQQTQFQMVINKLTSTSYSSFKAIQRYPILSHKLVIATNQMKNTYFQMLCLMIRVNGDILDEHRFLIQQIIQAVNAEHTFEEYMRQSCKITKEVYFSFMAELSKNQYQYVFALDLLSMAYFMNPTYERDTFLAKIIDTLQINEFELDFLLKIVNRILEHGILKYLLWSDMRYTCANTLRREFRETKKLTVIRAKDKLTVVSLVNNKIHLGNYFDLYGHTYYIRDRKTIRLVGVRINLTKGLDISRIDNLQLINCHFYGHNKGIKIHDCIEVNIIDCKFKGFKVAPINYDNIQRLNATRNFMDDIEVRDSSNKSGTFQIKETLNV